MICVRIAVAVLSLFYLQAVGMANTTNTLEARWAEAADKAQGRVGVATILLETGETHGLNSDDRYPMQSVYKFPIAMAILRQVDEGNLSLDQVVQVTPADYVSKRQHSPIRDKNPRGVKMPVLELLRWMVSQSDGSACDVLLRIGGGPQRVMAFLDEIDTTGVAVMNTEKEIGSDKEIQYRNYATPAGMAGLLASLHKGDGLSSESRALLLKIMTETVTGPRRLKGLLPNDTPVAHKTGSSGTVDGITAATNDVGIITLPDGRHLAIAVFVSESNADDATRERVIAEIAKAAYDAQVD